MLAQLRPAVVLAAIALVITGILYPLAGTGVSQVLFKHQANGSITPDGSTMIGQNWTTPRWFHGRPDDFGPYAANPKANPPVPGGDNPLVANGSSGASGGTNLGPRSKVLLTNTRQLVDYWHKKGVNPTPDLVTTSGSGLDPDITPEDAIVQIPMVSRARHISPARLRSLIDHQTRGAELGFLGSPHVNVLQLNQALARLR
jgi:potassium-transporting ATPase KdpC subunit